MAIFNSYVSLPEGKSHVVILLLIEASHFRKSQRVSGWHFAQAHLPRTWAHPGSSLEDRPGLVETKNGVKPVPSGKHTKNYGKSTIFNGKTHYKWPCSIAMLNYQRVNNWSVGKKNWRTLLDEGIFMYISPVKSEIGLLWLGWLGRFFGKPDEFHGKIVGFRFFNPLNYLLVMTNI